MMIKMFHVFIEAAADPSPAGVERLAAAMAKHYGLPAEDLMARFAQGRFRVKGNIDRAAAETYVRDLERLGARCSIEPASAHNSRPTPLPFPATRPATPLPFAATPPPARAPTPPPIAGYQSGLSAAFSGDMPAASLGALERSDDATFSLASVDGGDAAAPVPAPAFEPPAAAARPAATTRPTEAKPTKPAKPKDVPLDMFAPPDAGEAELKVELADDEVERSARKRASSPPVSQPVVSPEPDRGARAASEPARLRSEPSIEPRQPRGSMLGDPRVRLVAGVVLAIVLGFVPAHLVAASREQTTFAAIDAKVETLQGEAETAEAYAALDKVRDDQLDRKHAERRNIAMMALAIWAAGGGGLAYVWFRRIPWDRLDA